VKLAHLIMSNVTEKCSVWNLYGPAEATIGCTLYLVETIHNLQDIPMGKPIRNYLCKVRDEFAQDVIIDQEGELFVGGIGVFAGYFGRDDLTEKALVDINGEIFYRTGDLVRMDNNGLLHYVGRKDFQIKLHGQRIELGEIEQCLFNTSISACVVIKWGDDHLVAYVQSSNIDEKHLREHCQSHLPSHMIPSIFILLDKLPLNANGKIDRKLLPPPHFSQLSSTQLRTAIGLLLPKNKIEVTVHHIWCEIFQQNQISIDTNIFTIGGHSLLIMQLSHRYKTEFRLKTNTLSIADLFQHPTIADHAQLIQQAVNNTQNVDDYHWSSLHLIQGTNQLSTSVKNYILCFHYS
jgi:aryl carrier-like protein